MFSSTRASHGKGSSGWQKKEKFWYREEYIISCSQSFSLLVSKSERKSGQKPPPKKTNKKKKRVRKITVMSGERAVYHPSIARVKIGLPPQSTQTSNQTWQRRINDRELTTLARTNNTPALQAWKLRFFCNFVRVGILQRTPRSIPGWIVCIAQHKNLAWDLPG